MGCSTTRRLLLPHMKRELILVISCLLTRYPGCCTIEASLSSRSGSSISTRGRQLLILPADHRREESEQMRSTVATTRELLDEEGQLQVLSELKQSISSSSSSDPTHALDTWDTGNNSADPCDGTWVGIVCNSQGEIISISLSNRSLKLEENGKAGGGLPHSLSLLTSLNSLDLSMNNLSLSLETLPNSLPASIASLNLSHNFIHGAPSFSPFSNFTYLSTFALDNNLLSGPLTLPSSCFPNLLTLSLSVNSLSSSLPSSISSCSSLRHLDLSFNSLSGTLLPLSFPNLSSLVYLDISHNPSLGGSIPSSIGNCSTLQHLDLASDPFTGSIPPSLGLGCRNLTYLSLFYSSMNGTIPREMALLSRLDSLVLEANRFTGTILDILANCTELRTIDVFNNSFHGSIPQDFGWKLSKLTKLILGINQFTGPIPASIGNCTDLTDLILGFNNLSGTIPASLSHCNKMNKIDLQSCNLVGQIPSEIGNLTLMTILILNDNQLSGTMPQGLGGLASLQGVTFEDNMLSGKFPDQMFNCTQLLHLLLYNNYLEGPIPDSIARLSNLNLLAAQNNRLSGDIPQGLSNCTGITELYLGHNNFTGNIPRSLFSAIGGSLIHLDMSENGLSGSIPAGLGGMFQIQSLDVSRNRLSGVVPSDIVDCRALSSLNLSDNSLSGSIPSSLGTSLKSLVTLNLSHNAINGTIPFDLGNLTLLQELDLSSNALTGEIPSSLANIQGLAFLNLSFNDLNGAVPDGGVFHNLTSASFFGNPRLCGPILGINCGSDKGTLAKGVRIALVTCGALVAILCILSCLIYRFVPDLCRKTFLFSTYSRSGDKADLLDPKSTLMRLRWDEIQQATNHFSEENIIGRGGSGIVYKGILSDGQMVAFKKFTLDSSAVQAFFREIQSLGHIRHRNLIKILGYWSDHVNNILILEYMSKGNLDDYLHSGDDSNAQKLTWESRWKVATAVAEGLSYLHHGCPSPIVHGDIKPNNILFDADMQPHISDFGLARVVMDTVSFTRDLKGTIGYIAPECANFGQISIKCDVFSYGVLVMELVTGLRPSDLDNDELQNGQARANSLMELVDSKMRSCYIYDIIDQTLQHEFDSKQEQMKLILGIGLRCTHDNPKDRPTMEEIVKEMNSKQR